LQFAIATTHAKIAKEYVFANATNGTGKKYENTTMYIKNRRNSNKIKACGSYQTLCLSESSVLRNRLLFIYQTLCFMQKKPTAQITHLVLPTRNANTSKTKRAISCHPQKKETVKYSIIARCADTCRFNLKILY